MYSSHRCGVYILQMCDQPCPAHSTHGLATWPHTLPPDIALSRPIAAETARQAVSFAWPHRQGWGPCGGCDAHVQNVDKDGARRRFPPSLGIVRTVAITPREHGELRRESSCGRHHCSEQRGRQGQTQLRRPQCATMFGPIAPQLVVAATGYDAAAVGRMRSSWRSRCETGLP